MLLPLVASADVIALQDEEKEPYAVLSADNTVLTFYYDDQKAARNGMDVGPFYGYNNNDLPSWYGQRESITSVVFDASFANCTTLTSTAYWFCSLQNLSSITGIINLKTDNVTSMNDMFYNCSSLTSLDVTGFKTDNVTNMRYMFFGCSSLTSLDVTGFKTDNVTDMGDMFAGCSRLTSLDVTGFKTDNVTYMSGMFQGCSSLTSLDVTGFKTDKVTHMGAMFNGCRSLTSLDVTGFKTDNVMYMESMFRGCSGLTSLDVTGFKTDKVTDMNWMFSGCSGLTSLDVTGFKTNNVTDMNGMFDGCSSLTSLDVTGFKTENVTNMWFMFRDCRSLTSLDVTGFKTENVTNMPGMFYGCSNLVTIYVGDGWSTAKVQNGGSMFTDCTSLVGGAGTTFNASHVDYTYAHIDGGASNPGYFTGKNAMPDEDPNGFSLSFMGQIINDGATLLINAEGWSALGNIYTDPDGNTKNGLFVFVNKGGKVSGSYSLEILSNTLNGDLKWSMGGETYALNEVSKLEKSFSTDDNGIASVKFSAENIPNEGSLDAKLIVTIGEKTKTFYIKINFKKKDSPDLTVSGKVGEPVDLGLSVKWASWNVGAGAPEEYGNHYAWGELEPKTDYSSYTYKFYNNGYTKYGSIDNKYELDEEDDVARQKWGEDWRMPTFGELKELYEKCSFSNETYNGVPVTKVTGPNGNYIYMPGPGNFTGQTLYFKNSVGSYWSRDLETDSYAKDLDFFTGSQSLNGDTRYHGQSVRPVYAKPTEDLATPLTFEAIEGTVTVNIRNYHCSFMPTIQYSIDGGPWTDFTLSNNECHGSPRFSNLLPAGKVVSIRANRWYGGTWDGIDHLDIDCDADCYVYGNVMSLCKGEDFATDYEKPDYLCGLFTYNTHIRNHPTKNLVLPSTTLSRLCYARMFAGCTGLTRAPELPATTLAEYCYAGMFDGCTGLTKAPDLPATTLAELCYAGMFEGCTGLTEAPELPATKLERGCYISMFLGCKNLKYIKCHANENIIKGNDEAIGKPHNFVSLDKDDNGTVTSWLKDAGTNVTGTKTFIVNKSLMITGDDPLTATVENWGERSVSGIPEGWTLGNLMGETAPITIGKSGKASYCGDKSLDFSYSDEIKAYIATGFDKDEEIIWLTRVKDVPAGVPVLIKGKANETYQVPVADSQNSYYKNMFKGNTSGNKIQVNETQANLVNYYLSGDGTFKSVKGYVNIDNNKCYLQLPGTFNPAVAGATQTVTVGASGKASYAAPVDLDFTNVEGLKAFTATGYDKSTKTIWLTRVMKAQKGEGLLLKGDPKEYEIPSVDVQSHYENMFVGNISGDRIEVWQNSEDGSLTNFYLATDGTFKSVNGYVYLGNNKSYLALPSPLVSFPSTRSAEESYMLDEPEMISMPIVRSIESDDDGTTDLTPALSEGEGAYYNLQGQRVAKPGKGLYIRNGEKVVIK